MTDITVQKPKGLERTVQVSLSADEFSLAVSKKYNSLAGKVSIPGFRKGKVPKNVIAQKYGNSIIGEVTRDLVSDSLQKALEEHKLSPVDMPHINIKNNSVEEGLGYEAIFEEYPEIEIIDFAKEKLVVPTCSIADGDVKEAIEKVKEQNLTWSSTDKKAKKGNRVIVDFQGTIDKEAFEGGFANDFQVVLGAGQVLPEFDKALMGVVKGDDVTAKVTFSENYVNSDLAGKEATFEIHVKEVEVSAVPELNEELLKKIGIESGKVEDLEAEIKNTLTIQLNGLLARAKQERVYDLIKKSYKKTLLPKSLVMQEVERTVSTMPKEEQDKYKDLTADSKDNLVVDAKATVLLSLVCQKLLKEWKIKLDQKRFEDYVKQISGTYVDDVEFMRWFYHDEKRVEQIKYQVLEQQLIDAVIEKSATKEEPISFKKLNEDG